MSTTGSTGLQRCELRLSDRLLLAESGPSKSRPMSQTVADQIWNRAAQNGGGNAPGPGDDALASLLLLHGLAMNGGVHHAIDLLTPEELAEAISGFSYFGLEEMAEWLRNAQIDPFLKEWSDETETPAIFRYAEIIPDDESLVTRFEAVYRDRPTEFAAL